MEKKKTNQLMAKQDISAKKAKCYTWLLIKQSELFNFLDRLSTTSEEKLTKKDLYKLICCACDYMKAKSIYDYYCSLYRKEVIKEE